MLMLFLWLRLVGSESELLEPTNLDEIGIHLLLGSASHENRTLFSVLEGFGRHAATFVYDFEQDQCMRIRDLRVRTTTATSVHRNDDGFILADSIRRVFFRLDPKGRFLEKVSFDEIEGLEDYAFYFFFPCPAAHQAIARSTSEITGQTSFLRVDFKAMKAIPMRTIHENGANLILLQAKQGLILSHVTTSAIDFESKGGESKIIRPNQPSLVNPKRKNLASLGIQSKHLPRLSHPLWSGDHYSFSEYSRPESGVLVEKPFTIHSRSLEVKSLRYRLIGHDQRRSRWLVFDPAQEQFEVINRKISILGE